MIPNIEFVINRFACLFGQVYFEKDVSERLHEIINDSLALRSSDLEKDKIDFVECIINNKTEHRGITPKFSEELKTALLTYDRVFDNNLDILNSRKETLRIYCLDIFAKSKIDFKRVFKFYDSGLSKYHLFKVFIYPTKLQGTAAKGFGSNIFLKFNYGNRVADMCATIKEICHHIFVSREPAVKKATENYFMNHNSPHAKAAYFLLDEVLSYTIGAVWCYSKLKDNPDSSPARHSNENIEKVAGAILPIVEKYFNTNHVIDNNFYGSYITEFARHYGKAKDDLAVMLSTCSIIVENGIDVTYCNNLFSASFNISSVRNEPSEFSTVFIGKNLGDLSIKAISQKIPNKPNDFLFITMDDKKKLFIIIKSQDEDKIKSAVEKLKSLTEIKLGLIEDL